MRSSNNEAAAALLDVVIVGGGPAGLAAALTLGRARKQVLLCDAGPRRNAAAERIHNFVTRDGTPPDTFRGIARDQLATYPSVRVEDARVEAITGGRDRFSVRVDGREVLARRILLCTGMVDELLPIEGFRELWGHGIYQCPYCHGWEARDRPWGVLAQESTAGHLLPFALQLLSWTREVRVFRAEGFAIDPEVRRQLESAGLEVMSSAVSRLIGEDGHLTGVELADGSRAPCAALFAHPPQRQLELVQGLGLALEPDGFVTCHPMTRETSVAGVYAAGDLTSRMQAAIAASAAGMQAAAAINLDLMMSRAGAPR